jgi:hypothetical protein
MEMKKFLLMLLLATNCYAKNNRYEPFVAENGSYRGEINKKTYRTKDTYVKNYYKKDGTSVRSYWRSKKGK